jgi:alpha-mannosidase
MDAIVDTRGTGIPVVVFNPLSWERTAPVTVDMVAPPAGEEYEARDANGQALPAQTILSDTAAHTVRLQILAKNVPPLGYRTLHLVAAAKPRAGGAALKINRTEIENEFLRVRIDPHTGCISSLVNKADGKEAVAPGGCGNLLQAFKDVPRTQDAWEIRFDEDVWDLKNPTEVKVVESGPERAVVRIVNSFKAPSRTSGEASTLTRDVIVYASVPRVDVETKVNWREQHVLLKVGFPVNAQSDKATFEIPYGTIQRPTTRNTPEEKAMFEVPAIRWGDISNATQGFTLLNASKYGYDAKDNVIRLSLLRSPQMPAPDNGIADQGYHEFTYALYAHTGDWKTGGSMRQGYELNYPLIATVTQPHAGSMPASHSFARVEPGNVILTVMKKAEDSDAIVFRFYEFEGKRTDVKLTLPMPASSARETNLMEKSESDILLGPGQRELTVSTGPFEIKTVAVVFP